MYYVYVLQSKVKSWVYIGYTSNLRNRFFQHNNGESTSTKPYRPFELLYYEAYKSSSLARKREIELKKHGQKKEILFRRLGLQE